MSFLKRLKASRSVKSSQPSTPTTSSSSSKGSKDDPRALSPSASLGPLAHFPSGRNVNNSSVDLGQNSNWGNNVKQKSRLSKTLREVLHDPSALSYLIQYLEARDAVQLVKFWLDVEGFRASASTVITSSYVPPQVSRERLEMVPEDTEAGQELELEEAGAEAETLYQLPENSTSTDSFDSGFARSEKDPTDDKDKSVSESLGDNKSEGEFSSPISLNKIPVSTPLKEEAPSRAEHFLKTRTEDAVKIYRRYIAPDCQRPVHLPVDFKRDIVELICAETGQVAPNCFDAAQSKVVSILEVDYFPDFLKSEYHVKHQVDILTSGQVHMKDILFNETALFNFMEFLESQGRRSVIEFWLAANNFQQSTSASTSQEDAMVLYDKYFSMQAPNPLGFSDEVRLHIENNICTDGGPDSSCFHWPLEITVRYLEQNYLQKFLASHLYRNYIKELINSIQAGPGNHSFQGMPPSLSCGSLSLSRRTESDTHSNCSSSDLSSAHAGEGRHGLTSSNDRRSSNTLLAGASSGICSSSTGLWEGEQEDPSRIWRRKDLKNKVGRVNSFGRYLPGLDLGPDMSFDDGTSRGSRLSRAVKKLVTREDHERMKEEMAWQVAEMIVKDITSVTMPKTDIGHRTMSVSSDVFEKDLEDFRETGLRKSTVSESLSLQDLTLELPTSKYF